MHANSICMSCLLEKQCRLISCFENEEKKSEYMHRVLEILYQHGQSESAPWLAAQINKVYAAYWDKIDYTEIKHQYNNLLLGKEKELEQAIRKADDKIKECIKYVCAGNYIDFSAVKNVEEQTFLTLLDRATEEVVAEEEYFHFINDLKNARTLVYLTDNCGEIVLDKLFIRLIKEQYPLLQIHVIVRGEDVVNDATLEDAEEVGLTEIVPCIGNGNGAPGTVIKLLNQEAKRLLVETDLIISKGQGNFESLFGEGFNPYYLFLCKCQLFIQRFGLKQYKSMFVKEERIKEQNL